MHPHVFLFFEITSWLNSIVYSKCATICARVTCRAPFPYGELDLPSLALTLRLLDRKELLVGALRDMCEESESMRTTGVFGYHPRPKKNDAVRVQMGARAEDAQSSLVHFLLPSMILCLYGSLFFLSCGFSCWQPPALPLRPLGPTPAWFRAQFAKLVLELDATNAALQRHIGTLRGRVAQAADAVSTQESSSAVSSSAPASTHATKGGARGGKQAVATAATLAAMPSHAAPSSALDPAGASASTHRASTADDAVTAALSVPLMMTLLALCREQAREMLQQILADSTGHELSMDDGGDDANSCVTFASLHSCRC